MTPMDKAFMKYQCGRTYRSVGSISIETTFSAGSFPFLFQCHWAAINVSPKHLQLIVCKIGVDFFHGIDEFRNLHVVIQVLSFGRGGTFHSTHRWKMVWGNSPKKWNPRYARCSISVKNVKMKRWEQRSTSTSLCQGTSSMRLKRLAMPFMVRFSLPIFSWIRRSSTLQQPGQAGKRMTNPSQPKSIFCLQKWESHLHCRKYQTIFRKSLHSFEH